MAEAEGEAQIVAEPPPPGAPQPGAPQGDEPHHKGRGTRPKRKYVDRHVEASHVHQWNAFGVAEAQVKDGSDASMRPEIKPAHCRALLTRLQLRTVASMLGLSHLSALRGGCFTPQGGLFYIL